MSVEKEARDFYYKEIAPRISEPSLTSEKSIIRAIEILIRSYSNVRDDS